MRRKDNHFPIRGTTALLAMLAVATAGCASSEADEIDVRTTFGEPVAIGNGSARAYVTMMDGAPVEIGVALQEAALNGLPGHHDAGGAMVHGHMTFDRVLSLPDGHGTPYRHVLLNWNPGGHEPPGIYDMPHFDFHFYTISNEARLSIDESDPAFQQKAEREPPAELVPAGYILPEPLGFPRMGVHWVDPKSPELNGEVFSHTFIYGSWDGELIFGEPMLTKAFLESKQDVLVELPQPERHPSAGYYPTHYSMTWDDESKEYRIALTGLVKRD